LTHGSPRFLCDESDLAYSYLPQFPFTKTDPLIVTRSNPVDEYAVGER
jgi:oxalate decarboxylase